ncbi:MAG: hypothetical protein IKE17_05795 [Clostridia bacterium]|nr:hypothetical protein [Clostridia bacterium]
MYKDIIFAAVGVLFSLACIGEKQTENKVLYAVVAGAMFVLLLMGDKMIGG